YAAAAAGERRSSQVSLFGNGAEAAVPPPSLPAVPAWTEMEKLKQEFEAIGFYLSAHPVDAYRQTLERKGACPIAEIPRRVGHAGTARLVIGGTVVAKQEKTSARGSRFAFVQLSDSTGLAELTVFSEVLGESLELLEGGRPVLVTAEARLDGETLRMTAQRIEDLDRVAASTSAGIRVFLQDAAPLERL